MRYHFGKNWQKYLRHFTDERVSTAINCLQSLTRDIKNRSFLDIGCGSGLHSLAALRAGAREITSFDYDYDAVRLQPPFGKRKEGPNTGQFFKGQCWMPTLCSCCPRPILSTLMACCITLVMSGKASAMLALPCTMTAFFVLPCTAHQYMKVHKYTAALRHMNG